MRLIIKNLIQSLFSGIGTFWLIVEAYNSLNAPSRVSFLNLLLIGIVIGIIWFFIDGLLFSGYLTGSILLSSNAFPTQIRIIFGDIFKQKGWKAISVNEFFDSVVDGKHISKNSLHGLMLQKYWGSNIDAWNTQVDESLENISQKNTSRKYPGKKKKYPIGTTAKTIVNGEKFLCVALTQTDTETLLVSANYDDLLKALSGLLQKAREVCGGETLNIPLLGAGLAKTGIKQNIIVDLILLVIFEESKKQKITDEITIVLHKDMKKRIDLFTIKRDWS